MSDHPDSERPELPLLSEVGCNPNGPRCADVDANQNGCGNNTHVFQSDVSDEKWRLLLEQQNRNFLAIVQAMQMPSSSTNICLPNFDPEKRDIDSRAWLTTADMCVTDQDRQGPSLMIALSRALKGEASTWLSSVSYPGMTWGAFKELFITRYDCQETTASFLVNLNNKKPKENECLAAYAATLMTSIMSKWSGLTTEQIAIATVLAHVAKIDPRVQRLSFTTDIKTRSELQRELKAVSFLKRSTPSSDEREGPDAKKTRPNGPFTALKCFNCGRLGHKLIYCRHSRDMKSQDDKGQCQNPIEVCPHF